MTQIRAVLFDLDGTLRDTTDLIYGSLGHTFALFGLPSPGKAQLAPFIHHHSFVWERFASSVPFKTFDAAYEAEIQRRLPAVTLYIHAKTVMSRLHETYKVAIVTAAKSAPHDVISYGLDQDMDVLISAGDVARHKPDPEGLNLALSRLGVAPAEAVYVGDMVTDVQAAQAARLAAFIGITHGIADREQLEQAGADYLADSLNEIPRILDRIASV